MAVRRLTLVALLAVAAALAGAARADVEQPNDEAWLKGENKVLGAVHVPEVWRYTTGNPAVKIAVVDTGVNAALIDLYGQVDPGWDLLENDGDTQDLNG